MHRGCCDEYNTDSVKFVSNSRVTSDISRCFQSTILVLQLPSWKVYKIFGNYNTIFICAKPGNEQAGWLHLSPTEKTKHLPPAFGPSVLGHEGLNKGSVAISEKLESCAPFTLLITKTLNAVANSTSQNKTQLSVCIGRGLVPGSHPQGYPLDAQVSDIKWCSTVSTYPRVLHLIHATAS